jgi:hypothetical protein
MAIASVVFYVVFFVLTGEAGDTSRDGTISGLNGSIAKDVSSGFVINQSNQAVGSVEKIVLLGERHCGTNWITVSPITVVSSSRCSSILTMQH